MILRVKINGTEYDVAKDMMHRPRKYIVINKYNGVRGLRVMIQHYSKAESFNGFNGVVYCKSIFVEEVKVEVISETKEQWIQKKK